MKIQHGVNLHETRLLPLLINTAGRSLIPQPQYLSKSQKVQNGLIK